MDAVVHLQLCSVAASGQCAVAALLCWSGSSNEQQQQSVDRWLAFKQACSGSFPLYLAVGLCLFGFLGAYLGGANVLRGGTRVVVGGWLALGIVYGIGRALNVDSA
jgi:hypothetical protein